MTPVRDDRMPAELAELVVRAAGAVPPGTHTLAEVVRRRRALRRRRAGSVAGLAAVVVAAVAAGVPVLLAPGPAPRPTTDAAAAPPSGTVPVQRLLLDATAPGGALPPGVTEVAADGRLVTHRTPGMDNADGAAALPDGRLVLLGPRNLRPDAPREDGVSVADLAQVLAVTAPDGTPTVTRDVRVPGETVRLVGATAQGAYLLRGRQRLVLHDFGSGTERRLDGASAAIAGFVADRPEGEMVSVQGDRVVLAGPSGATGRIELRFLDLASGTRLGTATLDGAGPGPDQVRLSPDGRVAVVAGPARVPGGHAPGIQVEYPIRVIDVVTGERLDERVLFSADAGQKNLPDIRGMAFSDGSTLRVARFAPPDAGSGSGPVEALRVETVRI